MSPFHDLGKALRWMRRQRGLSQRDVARRARLTRPVLSAYENDRRQPSLAALGRLLIALDADLSSLQDALFLQQRDILAVERPDDETTRETVH